MAEHWIKFEPKTFDKPKVLAMKRQLKMDAFGVVGRLLKVWGWADTHSIDGKEVPLTRDDIDELADKRGFAAAMESVGWLSGNDGSLTFPDFWKHNGSTSKGRAVTATRVERHRTGNSKLLVNTSKSNGESVAVETETDCTGNDEPVTVVTVSPLESSLPDKKRQEGDGPPLCVPPSGGVRVTREQAVEWAEKIVGGYGLHDSPLECREIVLDQVMGGQVEPLEMLRKVAEVSRIIRETAPQRFGSAGVPRALNFFRDEQWRSPEMFSQRWVRLSTPPPLTAREKHETRRDALAKAATLDRGGQGLPAVGGEA